MNDIENWPTFDTMLNYPIQKLKLVKENQQRHIPVNLSKHQTFNQYGNSIAYFTKMTSCWE